MSLVPKIWYVLPALATAKSCSNTPNNNTWVHGWQVGTIEKSDEPTCCSMCSEATGCDAWRMDEGTCELVRLWTDSEGSRSNMRGSCTGRVNTRLYEHRRLSKFSVLSDQECCDACLVFDHCEGWEVYETSTRYDCYLYQFTQNKTGYAGGIAMGGGLAPSMQDKTCHVLPNYHGYGTTISKVSLLSLEQDNLDMECCAYCAAKPECEFWVRDTQDNRCWLMKDFVPRNNYEYAGWRTGFKPKNLAEEGYCKALQFLWRIAGNVLRRVTFSSLGSQIKNVIVDFPSELECGKLSFQDDKIEGVLSNMTIVGSMQLNGLQALGNVDVNVTLHIRAQPSFEVDFKTCTSNRVRAGLWDIGLDIKNNGHYANFLTHLISGGMYANLRNDCSSKFTAFPAEMVHGREIHKYYSLNGSSQEELNKQCCELCNEREDCHAFVQRMLPATPWCALHQFTEADASYNGNFKTYNTTMSTGGHVNEGTYMTGRFFDKIKVWGATQEERNAACEHMCLESDSCDMWSMSTHNRECTTQNGIAKQGTIQAFRWIVNMIVDGILQGLFGKSKFLCDTTWLNWILKFLEWIEDHSITGQGEVALHVPDDFWETANISEDGFKQYSFPATKSVLDFKANDERMEPFLQAFTQHLEQNFASVLGVQVGTTVPFAMGRFVRSCVQNGNSCPDNPPQSLSRINNVFSV